jgi:hypothetical protein
MQDQINEMIPKFPPEGEFNFPPGTKIHYMENGKLQSGILRDKLTNKNFIAFITKDKPPFYKSINVENITSTVRGDMFSGGNSSYHMNNGRKYKIHIGSKGGKYILVGKNKIKQYL